MAGKMHAAQWSVIFFGNVSFIIPKTVWSPPHFFPLSSFSKDIRHFIDRKKEGKERKVNKNYLTKAFQNEYFYNNDKFQTTKCAPLKSFLKLLTNEDHHW